MKDYIYVVAMFCLDREGRDRLRRRRSKMASRRLGHGDGCKETSCSTCYYSHDSRTVGWFPTEEMAREMVMKYAPWDHLYNHAVIEKVPFGFHCMNIYEGEHVSSGVTQWYKMTFRETPGENCGFHYDVAEIEKPLYHSDNSCCFTMG